MSATAAATTTMTPGSRAAACLLALAATGIFLVPAAAEEFVLDRPIPERVTGVALEAELRRPFFASWSNVRLRSALRRIGSEHRVALLLDRRLDPDRVLDWDVNGVPLLDALEGLAARAGGRAVRVGNVVYLAPLDAGDRVRGLVELTGGRLDSVNAPPSRRTRLRARPTIHWNDLDRPVDVVRRIAEQFELEIEGLDRVPHDLWAGATLPQAAVGESLNLVLSQYDLTFRWTEGAAGVEVVPAPEVVVFERRYTPRGSTALAALNRWRQEVPDLEGEVRGGRVVVRGTIAQHDALQALLQPQTAPRPGAGRASEPRPPALLRRQFTLQAERLPALRLMQTLQESGVVFEYDPDRLAAAGIDLNEPITVDADDAGADQFFHMVFDQLGLDHEIDDLTVRLTPKR